MRLKSPFLRSLICSLVAVAFAIAAEPGAMAMPAQHTMSAPMAMAHHMTASDQMQKNQGTPCKGMSVCFGMFYCYGMMATVTATPVTFADVIAQSLLPRLDEPAPGLTHPPENPPPIV